MRAMIPALLALSLSGCMPYITKSSASGKPAPGKGVVYSGEIYLQMRGFPDEP